MRLPIAPTTPIDAHVIVTSVMGTFHCGDVELTPTSGRQWLHDSPVTLTDPTYAYWWAADTALERVNQDRITRDVWLIIGGRVADHAHIRGI